MKNSVKTPYEIRLEILQLSFDILHQRSITDAHEKAEKDGKQPIIIAPTTEQVLTEAAKLNEFVSTASTGSAVV